MVSEPWMFSFNITRKCLEKFLNRFYQPTVCRESVGIGLWSVSGFFFLVLVSILHRDFFHLSEGGKNIAIIDLVTVWISVNFFKTATAERIKKSVLEKLLLIKKLFNRIILIKHMYTVSRLVLIKICEKYFVEFRQ